MLSQYGREPNLPEMDEMSSRNVKEEIMGVTQKLRQNTQRLYSEVGSRLAKRSMRGHEPRGPS